MADYKKGMEVRFESKISELICSVLFMSVLLNNQVIIKVIINHGNSYQYHHQHHSHHCSVHLGDGAVGVVCVQPK